MSQAQDGIVLTVGAVAQRLGVAVPTLRSWDRRYGLGPSAHNPGQHRRYTDQDLARLCRMKVLTGEGVPPASAARMALEASAQPVAARDGGGSGAQAVGRVEPAVRGLARAAARFDVDQVYGLVTGHIGERGVLRAWEELLVPLLHSFGQRFQRGQDVIAVEHAATVGILRGLHAVAAPVQQRRLPALLACAPEEQHTLPLEALNAAMWQQGCPTRFLGQRLPGDALHAAAHKLHPVAVVVWANTARRARRVPLKRLQGECSILLLVGPGWRDVPVAAAYSQPQSLTAAYETVLEATGDRTSPAPFGPTSAGGE